MTDPGPTNPHPFEVGHSCFSRRHHSPDFVRGYHLSTTKDFQACYLFPRSAANDRCFRFAGIDDRPFWHRHFLCSNRFVPLRSSADSKKYFCRLKHNRSCLKKSVRGHGTHNLAVLAAYRASPGSAQHARWDSNGRGD